MVSVLRVVQMGIILTTQQAPVSFVGLDVRCAIVLPHVPNVTIRQKLPSMACVRRHVQWEQTW